MRFSLLLLAAALVGCGGSTSPDTDGGSTPMTDGGSNPMTDGGSMPATDGGSMPTTDAGNPGGPGVMCGTMTCSDPQVCCTTFAMGAVTMTCTDSSMCMGATVSCDGPEDCPGQVCCAMRTPGGGGGTACVDAAECQFGQLCRTMADCDGMEMCCPLMGRNVCAPFCL
ncbi:MAG: hypothetical protein K8H88_03655 [Sandaracinaceae bacterium]|nr:hypothetical protein [Sandaracinaceae bacterium]